MSDTPCVIKDLSELRKPPNFLTVEIQKDRLFTLRERFEISDRKTINEVATTADANTDGRETRNSRVGVFFSSLFSTIGGVFGSNFREEESDMASTAILPHDLHIGENKQKNVIGEGMNRRALQDIGNRVDVSKRITRQEAEKNKKPSTDLVNEVAATKVLAEQKIVSDGKEIEIIVISSDEESEERKERKKKEHAKARNTTKQHSARKNVKTFSSVLSARSKAACGLAYKPKDAVEDIDAFDIDNELAAVEYIDDIYKFYKLTEDDSRVHDYMSSQPDVNAKMRSILVDWLIEVHRKFELMPETLHLTINILDRFLSKKFVSRRELQLVGISSMLIACKYEEIWAPEVNDFVCISDNAYAAEQVLVMEKTILRKLEWYLTVPTPYVFLVRYIKASSPSDEEMEQMVYFLAELSLVHYSTVILYSPSVIAASAVYAARCTLARSPFWTESLKHYTGYSEDQLRECAKLMISFHKAMASESKLRAVYKKFSSPNRSSVALLAPARNILA